MSKSRVCIAAVLVSMSVATPASAQIVSNGGFEQPWTGTFQSPGISHNPYAPSWAFYGGSGLISGNSSAFNTPAMLAGQGNTIGFLQANPAWGVGSVTTSITLATSGPYFLSFLNSARQPGCCGGNTIFDVLLDANQIGQFTTATGDAWSTKGASFTAAAGTYNLTFTSDAQQSFTGNTMFFDNVSVTATPEPASLALLGTGIIGIAGFAIRRKRNA